jgi:hypothetical protein
MNMDISRILVTLLRRYFLHPHVYMTVAVQHPEQLERWKQSYHDNTQMTCYQFICSHLLLVRMPLHFQ